MASYKAVKNITSAIQRLYPRELADNSWDNTGLILGAALESDKEKTNEKLNVLLTIDLTTAVCDEAISKQTSMVMAYHPFIFRGLKSVTPKDPQQTSLIKLARQGISVYCPHTAVDAAVGGVNDWLVDMLAQGNDKDRKAVTECAIQGHEQGGMGRVFNLKEPVSISELVKRTKAGLKLDHIQVAYSPSHKQQGDSAKINSIALCAGSGGGVLRGVEADLYFTGELSHHELLYLNEIGKSVIICGHSNTERQFLHKFKDQLLEELKKTHDGQVDVYVSETDKDPLETV